MSVTTSSNTRVGPTIGPVCSSSDRTDAALMAEVGLGNTHAFEVKKATAIRDVGVPESVAQESDPGADGNHPLPLTVRTLHLRPPRGICSDTSTRSASLPFL